MHGHHLNKEGMGRDCHVLQARMSLKPLKGDEHTIIHGFDVAKLHNMWFEGILTIDPLCRDNTCVCLPLSM